MRSIRATVVMTVVPVVLAACGSTSSAPGAYRAPGSTPTASPSAAASAPASAGTAGTVVVKTGTATVAQASMMVLTDVQGQTLYYRAGDGPTTVTCVGPCAANWPPILLASGAPSGASGVTGSVTVFVGGNGRQVLYNGHPLYLWVKDTAPGQATGQNIGGFKVVTPDIAKAG
ncbi:MAG TPA: hypothetical protein VGR61_10730 [Candidatus Dormibacteraeota bacterium]|nr:hypothetical protein [Candidatus Dormibacteraeota bacterium]